MKFLGTIEYKLRAPIYLSARQVRNFLARVLVFSLYRSMAINSYRAVSGEFRFVGQQHFVSFET